MTYGQQQRASGALPPINLLDANLAKRDLKYDQQRHPATSPPSPALQLAPPPPPPYNYTNNNNNTANAHSALHTLSYASAQQEARRDSMLEKEPPTPVSLPSIQEALGAAQPAYAPQSVAANPAQVYLPYSSPTLPNCSRKIRPFDHANPNDRTTPPATRPPTSCQEFGQESPSYRPGAQPPRGDVQQHKPPPPIDTRQPLYLASAPRSPPQHYIQPPHANHWREPRSIPAHDQSVHAVPLPPPPPPVPAYGATHYTYQHAFQPQNHLSDAPPQPPASYYPNHLSQPPAAFKPRESDNVDDVRTFDRRESVAYGESVKRHLEVFDLESALNEIAEGGKMLLDFSLHYRERAHATQRTGPLPGSTPHLSEIDDMMKHSSRIQDSLTRLRDVIQQQQAALAERSREQHLKAVNAAVSDGATDDNKDGGFAGSDAKKRRGRAAAPGRCHSCNRAETPEWRRGPDGARTLCNACGLHYAKLTRKMGANKAPLGNSNLAPKSMGSSPPA